MHLVRTFADLVYNWARDYYKGNLNMERKIAAFDGKVCDYFWYLRVGDIKERELQSYTEGVLTLYYELEPSCRYDNIAELNGRIISEIKRSQN